MPKHHNGYDDLSFVLQTLDNTGTICHVDPRLVRDWYSERQIERRNDNDAAILLSSYVSFLQTEGELVQSGDPEDRVTIHRNKYAFVAQFFTGARDNDNRMVPVLCFGRFPRINDETAYRQGITSLKSFLAENKVGWRADIERRYQIMLGELAKPPEPGSRLPSLKITLPHLRIPGIQSGPDEGGRVVRLGRRGQQDAPANPPDDDQAPPPDAAENSGAAQENPGSVTEGIRVVRLGRRGQQDAPANPPDDDQAPPPDAAEAGTEDET